MSRIVYRWFTERREVRLVERCSTASSGANATDGSADAVVCRRRTRRGRSRTSRDDKGRL